MALNESLHKAKALKRDEFYTQLEDIENELRHYKEPLINVCEAVSARQKSAKKRSL